MNRLAILSSLVLVLGIQQSTFAQTTGVSDFCQASGQIDWTQTLPQGFTATVVSCDSATAALVMEYKDDLGNVLAPGTTTTYSYTDSSGDVINGDFIVPAVTTISLDPIERYDPTIPPPAISTLIQGDGFYDQVIGRGRMNFGAYEWTNVFIDNIGDLYAQVSEGGTVLYEQNLGSAATLFNIPAATDFSIVGIGDFDQSGTDNYILATYTNIEEDEILATVGFGVDTNGWNVSESFDEDLPFPSSGFDRDTLQLIGVGDMDNDGYRDEIVGHDAAGNLVVISGNEDYVPWLSYGSVLPGVSSASAAIIGGMTVPGSPTNTYYLAGGDLDFDGFADDILMVTEQPNMPSGDSGYHFEAITFDFVKTPGTHTFIADGQYSTPSVLEIPGGGALASSAAIDTANNLLLSRDVVASPGSGGSAAEAGSFAYSIADDWVGGFTGNLAFTYTGPGATTWDMTFDTTFEILEGWEGVFTSTNNGDGTYTHSVTNASYNGTLNTGDTITLGFNANDTPVAQLQLEPLPVTNVSKSVAADWTTGFSGGVTFTYNGTLPVNSWQFSFDAPFNVYEVWDSVLVGTNGNTVTVTSESYNALLNPGDTITIGINANGDSTGVVSAPAFLGTVDEPALQPPFGETFGGIPVGGGGGTPAVEPQLDLRLFIGEGGSLNVLSSEGYPKQ